MIRLMTQSMESSGMISTCDEDIPMGAVGEVVMELKGSIICIIEKE
jgi:hypothetical protein